MGAQVKTFMAGSPVAIQAAESALGALDLMIEHGIRHLPVIDDGQRVVGVLSFDDLRAAFPQPVSLAAPPAAEARFQMRDLSVGEVMTFAPVTASAETPLEDAAALLVERRIGCLPVVDGAGRLDGIITETDMLNALVTVLWAERVGEAEPQRANPNAGLVDTLRTERDHILGRLGSYESQEQAITERRREGGLDFGDEGAEVTEAEFTEELAEMAARRLRGLEHAIERAEAGELGVCEACGGEIPEARLRALPGTTLCIGCARRKEAGGEAR